mmetsp:Transcript_22275/g.45873  ORF Transcript_22275/g.45873 Transcript_22275/m.45873 type:complete len:249 (-) Transcript_22275:496-1242(-)
MPEHHAELVFPVGLLYCRCDHRERWRGGACEEPHLRGVCLLYGELYLPDHRRMVVGRRLLGHHHLSWLHGFRGQRHCAFDGWRECSGRHRCAWPAQGSLREPGGVRMPQLAPCGAGHLCTLVRMVWLQPGLHAGDARRGYRSFGSTSGHEHHVGCCHGWHHGLPAALCHHEEVRCRWPLQRHLGWPRVHHCGLRQRGVRQRLRHRIGWCLRVPGLVYALAEAENRRPRGCQPRARLLWHLGRTGSRTL